MNEFFYSLIVLSVVCVLLECLLPKKSEGLGTLCSLFVVVCVLGVFTLSDGFDFPASEPVAYDALSDFAFCEACEREVVEICEEFGVFGARASVISADGRSVRKIVVEAEENDPLAARLREIFGCEVIFE